MSTRGINIELHTGPMFAGKTKELLRLMGLQERARLRTILFRPKLDTRLGTTQLTDHDGFSSYSGEMKFVESGEQIFEISASEGYQVVGVDEIQFFDSLLPERLYQLGQAGKRVICTGLDTDFLGKIFELTMQLMAYPEVRVIKWPAVCQVCGEAATRTLKIAPDNTIVTSTNSPRFEVGDQERYRSVCHRCFYQGMAGLFSPRELELLLEIRRPVAAR